MAEPDAGSGHCSASQLFITQPATISSLGPLGHPVKPVFQLQMSCVPHNSCVQVLPRDRGVCVCVPISSSYRTPGPLDQGPTLGTSLNLTASVKTLGHTLLG